MYLTRLLPVVLAAGLLLVAGCDTAGPAGPAAPAVVAPSAFTFDATFPQSVHAAGGMENWSNAAVRVGVVTLGVGVHLVVPAAATNAATQQQPFIENGTWIWQNVVPVNGADVAFRLEGTPDGQHVDWRMVITSDTPIGGAIYDHFALYTGTTALNGREGDWELYYLIDGQRTQVLTAGFDVTSESVREITFAVPQTNPNQGARGSTVRYTRAGDARLFDWHQEPEDFDHLIEWNEVTQAGSITATNYNGGARACWDTALQNVAC